MRRRDLMAIVAGTALLGLDAAGAQERKRRLIATLTLGSQVSVGLLFETFRRALAEQGQGADKVAIESRWADGEPGRLPVLAAELVRLAPDVILAGQSQSAKALKQATGTIPIVFAVSDDPVGTGLVASLAHPGGNLTGLSFAQEDTLGRELQLLKSMAPDARRIGVLANPHNPTAAIMLRVLRQAAAALAAEAVPVEASSPAEIEQAFAALADARADALLVFGDGLFTSERKRLIALAAKHHLPAIYHDHIYVEDGGLMSYGGDFADNYRGAAVLVDKILRGAKPADLPVEEPTKYYLFINRRTADALGLTVPPLLIAQADKVIVSVSTSRSWFCCR